MSEAAFTSLLGELLKAGLGWGVAGYLWFEVRRMTAERIAADAAARDLIIKVKDESNAREIAQNDRRAATFEKNAEALLAMSAKIDAVGVDVRNLSGDVRGRPCIEVKR